MVVTHKELVDKSEKWLMKNSFPVIVKEGVKAFTDTKEEPDILGFNSRASILLEIKVSREDFLADKKKPFRKNPDIGLGEWRYYVCPENLIKIQDLPDKWGLIWFKDNQFIPIHGWLKGNIHWGDETKKPFKSNKKAERAYMYSMLRRLAEKKLLKEIYK